MNALMNPVDELTTDIGQYEIEVRRDGVLVDSFTCKNLLTQEGVAHKNSVAFAGGAAQTLWYIGLFTGNYTPLVTVTAATISTLSTEAVAYTPANRVQWVPVNDLVGLAVNNNASPAVFKLTADQTFYGAFLVSSNVRNGTTGVLMSASRFPAARTYYSGDEISIKYSLTVINA